MVTGLVLRHRLLKAPERRRPKFHAIQIFAQAVQRFDQIVDDRFFGLFRHHSWASIPQSLDHLIGLLLSSPWGSRYFVALWFRDCRPAAWQT
jgi:hypothetical protein